jgi:hypothetical protein
LPPEFRIGHEGERSAKLTIEVCRCAPIGSRRRFGLVAWPTRDGFLDRRLDEFAHLGICEIKFTLHLCQE